MEKFSLNFDFDHVGTSISPLKVSYVCMIGVRSCVRSRVLSYVIVLDVMYYGKLRINESLSESI